MKITKLLFLAVAVFFLSCGDDKDEDPVPTGDLAGSWNVTAIDYAGTSSTVVMGIESKATFTGTGKNMNLIVTFTEDPNKFTSQGDYVIALKTTIQGQTIDTDYPVTGFMTDGTWSVSGKTLTVEGDGGKQEATIIEQTATTLKMKWDHTQTTTTTESGIEIVSSMAVKGTYTFTKK
jgi:hypothetical protein